MTTGATGQLGLALPVQGELSGTWGDTVNNGITQYTNIAIAATLTLTNDGAVTLANTTGDASASNITSTLTGAGTVTAQFAIVRVTGTLTTTKVVTAPSYSKTYVVVNAATGGIVTFKASGQTGVSIAVGESAWVYFNGTDYVKLAGTVNTGVTSFQTSLSGLTPSTSTTGAVTLAGTLGTANGGTNLTSFTSGGVVYASSTSALATGSVLSFDGTNLGIGTNSPQRKLHVKGGAGLAQFESTSSTCYVYLGGSTSSAIDNQGIAVTGNDLFALVGGSERLRITSAGNVGIATTAPTRLLEVGSGSTLKTAIGQSLICLSANAGNLGYVNEIGFGGGASTNVQSAIGNIVTDATASSNGALYFATRSVTTDTAPTERMRITSAGDVGIGTSSPSQKLHVAGNILASGANPNYYAKADNSGIASFYTQNAAGVDHWRIFSAMGSAGEQNNLVIRNVVGASNVLNIDTSGNLGLGVTPSAWFANSDAMQLSGAFIQGRNNNYGILQAGANAYLSTAGNWTYLSTAAATLYSQSSGIHEWYTAASGTAGNTISFTQAMTLDASGNLGIGTSSPAEKLHISNGASTCQIRIAGQSRNFYIGQDATGAIVYSDGAVPMSFYTNATEKARISSAGGFSVGTTADPGAGAIYATGNITAYYSDARLKTVSGKIENALDKVAQLSGVYYTNNSVAKSFGYDSDEVQVGVLAQDVEAVLPQIVKAAPFDLDADGNSKSGENYKTVQYERLVPLLIEAINELRAEVKALKG